MNRPTRDAQFLTFTRGLVAPAPVDMGPLDALEAKARASNFRIADNGSLLVIARADGSYAYQFGDVMVSRREAALRVQGRAS
jgi:hypothetical protein